MQSLLKQQLRRPIDSLDVGGEPDSRSKKRPKQDAPHVNKEGAQLKCGCGPWNKLPTLQLHRRKPL